MFSPYCLALILGSYGWGSLSFAILVTRLWSGQDIRTLGNRNAGAANVARSVGLLPAVLVGGLDASKGALPIWIAREYGLGETCAIASAIAAVLGHCFPLFFRFRGGKGLAAALGALLALTPLETLLVLPVLGVIYLVITGSSVTGSLIALALLTGLQIWRGYPGVIVIAPTLFLLTMGICSLPDAVRTWRSSADKRHVIAFWLYPRRRRSTSS